jgi:hypothetical protein
MSQSDIELHMQTIFMHRVLRALVQTHPRRHALVEAWQTESSEALAHLGIQSIGLGAADEVGQAVERAFWQWNSLIRELPEKNQAQG